CAHLDCSASVEITCTPSIGPLLSYDRHVHHRAPHPFPTRRSSDLNLTQNNAELLKFDGKPSWGAAFPQAMQHVLAMLIGNITPRSEEHTSELQSRFDLVCRLLLEKKKELTRARRSRRTSGCQWTSG